MSCGLYAAAADHVEHDGSMAPGRAWRAPAPPGRQDPAGVSTGMPRGPPSASAPGLAGAQGQPHGRITLALVFSSVLPGPALPGQLADDPPAPSRSVTAIGKSDALPAAVLHVCLVSCRVVLATPERVICAGILVAVLVKEPGEATPMIPVPLTRRCAVHPARA
jgi:hypothetical protein